MTLSPMDELRVGTTQITQELMKLNLGKVAARRGPKISLKNDFARNF